MIVRACNNKGKLIKKKKNEKLTFYSLGYIAKYDLGYEMDKEFQKYWINRAYDDAHSDAAIRYAAYDTIILAAVHTCQGHTRYRASAIGATRAINEHIVQETSFIKHIAHTEYVGIGFDSVKWAERATQEELQCEEAKYALIDEVNAATNNKYISDQTDMFGLPEFTLNFNSPIQLLKFCNEDLKLNITDTAADTLEKHKDNSIINHLLEYRKLAKEVSTYGSNFLEYINPTTNRIHTNYWQIANTNRLRSRYPNMQNIPQALKYRECFKAVGIGRTLVIADYSSQESRILAHLSQDPDLLAFYKDTTEGADLHSFVAQKLYPETVGTVRLTDVKLLFPKERQNAKAANFALAYGGDAHTIANNLGVSLAIGKSVEDAYFKAFPTLKTYFNRIYRTALTCGYILIPGRGGVAWLPEYELYTKLKKSSRDYTLSQYNQDKVEALELEYKGMAYNWPIQGLAAMMTKKADAMFSDAQDIDTEYQSTSSIHVVSYIHDELIVECDTGDAEDVAYSLTTHMERAAIEICSTVPVPADFVISSHWLK